MIRAAILLPLVLVGCKSTEAFMALPPHDIVHTAGTPKDIAFCIGTAENAPALEGADGSRLIRVPTIYGGSGEAFTIRPEGDGSIVEYRRANGLPAGRQSWRKCVAPAIS